MTGRASADGTKARATGTGPGAAKGKRYTTIARRIRRLELFPAVGFALVAGVAVAVAAYGLLYWALPASEAKAAPIDITRLALTIVAGVGGTVALVVAYRRQRDIEQSRFVERFGAAAGQLGATDVAVRIAGVYAMAGAADESEGLRRQQCIDVLCGYLRLPYDPAQGSSGRTKLVTTLPRADHGETEEHVEYRQNDREVRRTILRVIADHLRPGNEYCWSAANFDFRSAHLEEVAFDGVVFSGRARFDRATFDGRAEFGNAVFNGPAGFDEAIFGGPTVFDGAKFAGDTLFGRATFNDSAEFRGAAFRGDAAFYRAVFNGHTEFRQARFDTAGFYRATFNGHARFDDTIFGGGAVFHGATFNGHAEFQRATFNAAAGFGKTTFDGRAEFGESTFHGEARFAESAFNGPVGFTAVAFIGPAIFSDADFGSEKVTFDDPAGWGPPAPVFDWDQNIAAKPANIDPQDWPPTPVHGRSTAPG
ncbi:pentapeptide repeat-containing protein [Nocardia wallacei]|uniref:pentapeptide repeat-containing protein n=1 Tax=Nocardia wallacei TaxID=480035 RepID=UPI002454D45F|nr:pentapeptide repeat-containing protein [Nocardia wallacei]